MSESGARERLLRNIRRRFSKQISRDRGRGLRCGLEDFIYQGIQVKQINKMTCWYLSVFVVAVDHFIIKCNNPSKPLIVITSTDRELSLTKLVIVLIVNTFITLNFNIILCLGPFLHSTASCFMSKIYIFSKFICIIGLVFINWIIFPYAEQGYCG